MANEPDPIDAFYQRRRPQGAPGVSDDPIDAFYRRELSPAPAVAAPADATGRRGTPDLELFAPDVQRKATALERVASAAMVPINLRVGLADAAIKRQNPLQTVPRAVFQHRTFGDVLREALPEQINVPLPYFGVGGPSMLPRNISPILAQTGGFGLDMLGPEFLSGFGGLTRLGEARKVASLGRMTAELGSAGGDVSRARGVAQQVGELAPTMAEQARRGERALVSFAGQPVIKGAPVLGAAEKVLDVAKGLTPGLRVAPELGGLEREAFLARSAEASSARRIGETQAIRALTPIAQDIRKVARKHGVEEEPLKRALSEAIEQSKVPDDFPVLDNLLPQESQKYRRWVMQGNAARRGFAQAQPELSAAQDVAAQVATTPSPAPGLQRAAADEIERETLRRMGGPPGGFPAPAERLRSLSDPSLGQRELASAGTAGRPSIFTTKRGNVQTTGGQPNLLTQEGAFIGRGAMPDEMLNLLPQNTRKAIRAMETKALYRAQLKKMDEAIADQMATFGPEFAKAAHGPARRGVTMINAMNAVNLARKKAEGIPIERLMADEQYLRHLTTPQAQRLIDKNVPGGFSGFARQFTERHGAQRQRELQGTLAEINDRFQAGEMALTGFKPTKHHLFQDDPFLATVSATGEAEQAIQASRLLKDYARVSGQPSASAPPGWLEVGSDLPELQGIRFPPAMARTLSKHFAPSSKKEFARAWKIMNRAWARSVTGPFPGFHTRNEIGDVWNGIVLGGADPVLYYEAIPMLFGRNMDKMVQLGHRRMTRQQVWDLADRLNAVNSGFVGELRSGAAGLSGPKGFAEKIDQNIAQRAAQKMGEARENSTRLVAFMSGLKEGMEPAVAAELKTRTFLFDYGRSPDAVGALRNHAMPFLVWTYYNAPLQASMALRRPGPFLAAQAFREEARAGEPLGLPGGAEMPGFLRERLPVRAGVNPQGDPQFMALEGFLPAADLSVLTPGGAVRRAESLVSPLITAPIEALKNYSQFQQRPLAPGYAEAPEASRFFGLEETTPFLGARVPSRLMPFVSMIRALTEANRLAGLGGGPVPGFPTRLAQFATGARLYPIDVQEQLERRATGKKLDISKLKTLARRYERRGDEANAKVIYDMIERASR